MNEVKFKANKKDLEALGGEIQEATAALDTTDATAGQVLKVETPGEAPVWGEAGGGGEKTVIYVLPNNFIDLIFPSGIPNPEGDASIYPSMASLRADKDASLLLESENPPKPLSFQGMRDLANGNFILRDFAASPGPLVTIHTPSEVKVADIQDTENGGITYTVSYYVASTQSQATAGAKFIVQSQ